MNVKTDYARRGLALSAGFRGLGTTVNPGDEIGGAKTTTPPPYEEPYKLSPVWAAISTVSGAACAYHGYKRNDSAGWALGWFIFGGAIPFLAVPVALAQGFGKRA